MMYSKDILDVLYDCNLFHLNEIKKLNDKHRQALDRLIKAEIELIKSFPECKDLLEKY